MKKTSKIILLITIILVIICAIVYVITIKLKQNDEKISKLESKISNAQENNENNNSINNTKIENISNNGIENAKENSNKIEDFSMNDLKIDGITFGSSKDQVIQKYGSDCTSKSYAEGATGETITELTYEKLGLLINLRTNEEGCSVDSIFILKNTLFII